MEVVEEVESMMRCCCAEPEEDSMELEVDALGP